MMVSRRPAQYGAHPSRWLAFLPALRARRCNEWFTSGRLGRIMGTLSGCHGPEPHGTISRQPILRCWFEVRDRANGVRPIGLAAIGTGFLGIPMLQHADQTLIKLRQLIASGGLAAGGRIPPERTLANEMGVGRRSLRRALEILEQEGQITRHQGRGTFVQGKSAPAAGPIQLHARDDVAVAATMSAIPFDRILEFTNPLEVIEVRLA